LNCTPEILVIGGTGFIGHHLLKETVNQGWSTTSASLNPPSLERRVAGVNYLVIDITKQKEVQAALARDFDYVVNLGGYPDHTLFQRGGKKLLESHFTAVKNLVAVLPRKSLKRFVQIGSSDEYGNAPAPQNEKMREQPISPYSLAKTASTHLIQMLHRTEGFPGIVLRPFLTYGPNQDDKRFFPQIIKGCLSGLEFPASEGKQLRDFCYVEDTVRAIMMALESKVAEGAVFNVSSGIPVTIRSVIEEICRITGKGYPQFGELPHRPGVNTALYADIQQIQNVLGWQPKVSLHEGLRRTVEWVKKTNV